MRHKNEEKQYFLSTTEKTFSIRDENAVEKINFYLKQGGDVNAIFDRKHNTLLHLFCSGPSLNLEVIKLLLKHKAEHSRNIYGYTPITLIAKYSQNLEGLALLLDHGVEHISSLPRKNDDLLWTLCKHKETSLKAFKLMEEKVKGQKNIYENICRSGDKHYSLDAEYLYVLCKGKNLDVLKHLITKGFQPTIHCLYSACEFGQNDIIDYLITEHQFTPDQKTMDCAVKSDNFSTVKRLIHHGALVEEDHLHQFFSSKKPLTQEIINFVEKNGWQPTQDDLICHIRMRNPNLETIKYLIDTKGLQPTKGSMSDLLCWALIDLTSSGCSDINLYKYFIEEHCIDLKNNNVLFELIASEHVEHLENHKEIIKYFIQKGVNINEQIISKRKRYIETALHHLCTMKGPVALYPLKNLTSFYFDDVKSKNEQLLNDIKLLIEYKVDINAQNREGNTAAHILCKKDNVNIPALDFLIKNKANVKLTNNKQQTCLHYLSLRHKSYDKTLPNQFNKTLNIEPIEFLLKAGVDPNAIDIDGRTCLHYICSPCGYEKMDVNLTALKFLLEHKANPTILDKNGKSCLDYLLGFLTHNPYYTDQNNIITACQLLLSYSAPLKTLKPKWFASKCNLFLMSYPENNKFKKSEQNKLYLYHQNNEFFYFESSFGIREKNTLETNLPGIDKQKILFDQPENNPKRCENDIFCKTILTETCRRGHTYPAHNTKLCLMLLLATKNAKDLNRVKINFQPDEEPLNPNIYFALTQYSLGSDLAVENFLQLIKNKLNHNSMTYEFPELYKLLSSEDKLRIYTTMLSMNRCQKFFPNKFPKILNQLIFSLISSHPMISMKIIAKMNDMEICDLLTIEPKPPLEVNTVVMQAYQN